MNIFILYDPYDLEKEYFVFSNQEEAEIEFHFRKYVRYSIDESCPMPRVSLWKVLGMTKVHARTPDEIPEGDKLPF